MNAMTLMKAREIGVKLRCDHRSVLRAWREPGCVRGMLGEALEAELAPLRATLASTSTLTGERSA